MPTRDEYIKAILDAAGKPDAGAIKDNIDLIVDAIVALEKPAKEVRVVEPAETRKA